MINSAIRTTAEETFFVHGKKTIMYSRHLSNVSHPPIKNVLHVNMSEQSVHFCRLGLKTFPILQTLAYYTLPVYLGSRKRRTSFLRFLGSLSLKKVFNLDKPATNCGRQLMPLPKQKPVGVEQRIFSKCTKSGVVIHGSCMGTEPTSKSWLMKPQNRNFSVCYSEGESVGKIVLYLLEIFAGQILKENSDIVKNADMENESRLYFKQRKLSRSGLTWMAWESSQYPLVVEWFPPHVIQVIFQYQCGTVLHEKTRYIPWTSWSEY